MHNMGNVTEGISPLGSENLIPPHVSLREASDNLLLCNIE